MLAVVWAALRRRRWGRAVAAELLDWRRLRPPPHRSHKAARCLGAASPAASVAPGPLPAESFQPSPAAAVRAAPAAMGQPTPLSPRPLAASTKTAAPPPPQIPPQFLQQSTPQPQWRSADRYSRRARMGSQSRRRRRSPPRRQREAATARMAQRSAALGMKAITLATQWPSQRGHPPLLLLLQLLRAVLEGEALHRFTPSIAKPPLLPMPPLVSHPMRQQPLHM